jgi:hypothetical protein
MIRTKFLPPTNTLGARVVAESPTGRRYVQSYDHSAPDAHRLAAQIVADAIQHALAPPSWANTFDRDAAGWKYWPSVPKALHECRGEACEWTHPAALGGA